MVVRAGGGHEHRLADAGPHGGVDEVAAVAQPLGRAGVRVLEDEDERACAAQRALDRGGIVKGHEPGRDAGPALLAQPASVTLVEERVRLDPQLMKMLERRAARVPRGADDVDRTCRGGHHPHPASVLTGSLFR